MGITAWHTYITNGDPLVGYFEGGPPALRRVRIRSVHPDGWGGAVVLRIDLPRPEHGDTLQCHLKFLAVEDFDLRLWEPPARADVALDPHGTQRLAVTVQGDRVALGFDAHRSLHVDHVSTYRSTESGPRAFDSPLDARLHPVLPPTTARTFYEHP
jgi:hypothetical protein